MGTVIFDKKIAVIGGGHIGTALVSGLVRSKIVNRANIVVSTRSQVNQSLDKLDVKVINDNRTAIKESDWIFLAVKPTILKEVISEFRDEFDNKLIVSLAAVVTKHNFEQLLGNIHFRLVRVMPNMGMAYNKGVFGLYNVNADGQELKRLKSLLTKLGSVIELKDEKSLDITTVISGCGPALFAFFVDILEKYGEEHNIEKKKIRKMVVQTMKGTSVYLEKSGLSGLELMNSVATQGGVTKAILDELKQVRNSIVHGVDTGMDRINELRDINKHETENRR